MEALADDKINVTEKWKLVSGRVENIVVKKEKIMVISIFSFSHNVFKSLLFQGPYKSGLCGKVSNDVQTIIKCDPKLVDFVSERAENMGKEEKMLVTSIFSF